MKKTLVAFGLLTTLLIGAQTTWAACPCSNPCPTQCPIVTPCQPACPVVCPAAPCPPPACNLCTPKCKCKWYKIFQDKTDCDKPNKCGCGLAAKRAHWYKFWEDRCIVKQSAKADCNDKCNKCNDCDN